MIFDKETLKEAADKVPQRNAELQPRVIVVTSIDDADTLRALEREAGKYDATIVVVSSDAVTAPIDLLKVAAEQLRNTTKPQSMGINDGFCGSGPSGQDGPNRKPNWLHGNDKPWKHKY